MDFAFLPDTLSSSGESKLTPQEPVLIMMTTVVSEEIETTMRNMGVTCLDQLNPSYVNSKRLELELPDGLSFGVASPAMKSKL